MFKMFKAMFALFGWLAQTTPRGGPCVKVEPYLHRINDTARRAFAGMVTAVDEGIGNITKALEEKGMLANSVARRMSHVQKESKGIKRN